MYGDFLNTLYNNTNTYQISAYQLLYSYQRSWLIIIISQFLVLQNAQLIVGTMEPLYRLIHQETDYAIQ